MFIKKILPVLAFAAFTTQPLFAADSSSSNSATDTSTPTSTSMPSSSMTDNSASTSSDMGDKGKCGCCFKKQMKKMFESLQLTDAQKSQIKAIREKAKASLKDSKDQLKEIRKQIHSLVTSSSLDNSKLDALINQKTTILAKVMKVRITAKHQIYNVLNPQQQQQFRQMMQQWMQERHSHKCH